MRTEPHFQLLTTDQIKHQVFTLKITSLLKHGAIDRYQGKHISGYL